MTRQELIEELAVILNEDPETFSPDNKLEDLPGWDSTGLMGVMALLDGDLGVTVDVEKLRDCKTIGDLVQIAADKLEG